MSFFNKEEYTFSDIQSLIDNQIEESMKLDYKRADSLGKTDAKKKEISKDVSSFANTIGGIIIYGLDEIDHVATNISFIDGNSYTKEWLEDVITGNIYRKIEGLKIFIIRAENDITKTIYIVKIPSSNNAPHMAKDNRFYCRRNFKAEPMEEYEVRNTYSKKAMTYLDILRIDFIKNDSHGYPQKNQYTYMNFIISPVIKNISHAIEQNYKLEISVSKRIASLAEGASYWNRENLDEQFYSQLGNTPIFPDEEFAIHLPIKIRVDARNSKDQSNFDLKVKLYYSSGITEKNYNLLDIFLFDGKRFSEVHFVNQL